MSHGAGVEDELHGRGGLVSHATCGRSCGWRKLTCCRSFPPVERHRPLLLVTVVETAPGVPESSGRMHHALCAATADYSVVGYLKGRI